jgi:hypothetical protein
MGRPLEVAVATVDDVIARMRALESELPRNDGVAVFNRVYLQVTERVRDRLADGFFADPRFMARLDVVFAQFYFDAVEAALAGRDVPAAWQPLFAARTRRGIVPVQYALAGMNAHINHDLALAVVAVCARSRRHPAQVRADYERINEVLASVVRPVRQSFLDTVVVRAGAPLSPLADLVSAWSLEKARDAAWVSASTLWELRPLRTLTAAYRGTLARTVGLVGRQLLVAVGAETPLAAPAGG